MSLAATDREAGELACEILGSRLWVDHASTMHADVMTALRGNGFDVWAEWHVELADGRSGRIDIVAKHGCGGWVAIELDCRKPRRKSVAKLMEMSCFRIVGLRGIEGHIEPGIHACVAMRVRFATAEHKADRRIYRDEPEWASDWKGAA